jgi:hypothetical protein
MNSENTELPKELDVLFLGFKEGFIPVRVATRNYLKYYYDFIVERTGFTGIPPQTFMSIGSLSSNKLGMNDILNYTEKSQLMVIRIGISPNNLRMYYSESGSPVNVFDPTHTWYPNNPQFGFVSGFESPFDQPTKYSDIFVVPQATIQFYLYNSTQSTVLPVFNIEMSVFKYQYIKDPDYIFHLVEGDTPKKPYFYTIGNYYTPLSYSTTVKNMMEGAPPVPIPYSLTSADDIKRVWGGY